MPATLDMFLSSEKREEKGQPEPESFKPEKKKAYEKIYIVTQTAYEKRCSKCRMLLKAEEVESPMFRYRVFCKAEYCTGED
ncbi:hypothetical protein J7L27_01325 [Candidatus Bathyarchaeota archaeon]|nr:hypothetical protein [Candidatus Bathyarchaeota archaeon]